MLGASQLHGWCLRCRPAQHWRPWVTAARCRTPLRLFASDSQDRLPQWVSRNGGHISATVEISSLGSHMGAGLRAAQSGKAGETLVSLPQQCLLSYDCNTDPNLLQLIDKVPNELWGAKLALRVLRERLLGDKSFFADYVDNLPMGVPGIPIFFAPEAVKALEQYPPLSEQVKKRCRWLLSFSAEHLSKLPGTPADPFCGTLMDANTLGWALSMTTSRAFRVRGPDHPAAQLPLIDMCNHSFQPNCEVRPGAGASVEMVARRDIAAGEDLLLSYGKLDNTLLLLDYGFIVPGNIYDTVLIRYDSIMFEAGHAMASGHRMQGGDAAELGTAAYQRQLLTELDLVGPQANLELAFRRALQRCSPRLVAVARLLCTRSAEEVRGRSAGSLGAWDQPLSLINEVKALRMLAGVGTLLLSRFPTSLEDDRKLLQESGAELSRDMRLALSFRMEKKQVLSELLQDIAHRIRGMASQPLPGSAVEEYQRAGASLKREFSSAARRKGNKKKSKGFG